MDWRRITGLSLLMFGLAGTSVSAQKPTLADAAEQRNRALIRTLLGTGADVRPRILFPSAPDLNSSRL